MDNKRASEIIESPEMINVTFNGFPIYIESVNTNDNTATISYMKQPERKEEVQVTHLVELVNKDFDNHPREGF